MNPRELLFKKLEALNIASQTISHMPVFTCEEALKTLELLPVHGSVKNLFLKDKKKRFWLIVAVHTTQIQLKGLAKFLPAPELRFAGSDDLFNYLGVLPGSVTPLSLINDKDHVVNIILDEQLFDHQIIGVHPLSNDATTLLTPQDLKNFIESCGNPMRIIDFSVT